MLMEDIQRHIIGKSLANASKISCWQVTDANYLPAGEYIKNSQYFLKTLNFYNLSVNVEIKMFLTKISLTMTF